MESRYEKDLNCIHYGHMLKQDIVATLDFDLTKSRTEFFCKFEFFNYGDNIVLQQGVRENLFTPYIGAIQGIYAVTEEDEIEIRRVIETENYGDAAIGKIFSQGGTIDEVLITPLAYYSIKSDSPEDRELILVQFFQDNQYLIVLFKGEAKEWLIVNSNPQKIISTRFFSPSSALINGYGDYWKRQ